MLEDPSGFAFSQATDPQPRQPDGGNRQRPPNTIEMGGIISSSATVVNILLGSSAREMGVG